jgi:chloride channel 7
VSGYRWQYVLLKWTFAFVIGLGTALTAFLINLGVENAAGAKFILLFKFVREGRVWLSFASYTLINFCLVLISSLLVAYVAPAAAGSGIPEVKSYLNGNDIPEILSTKTLLTKVG